MMTFVFYLIAVCSVIGPMSLTFAVTSQYKATRIGFAMLACVCTGLMWFLFGTYFGPAIMGEIMMYMVTPYGDTY